LNTIDKSSSSEFIEEGGDEAIWQTISQLKDTKGNPNARVAGCSINGRALWSDAVVSFFGGGAYGAYVGCTGGTVALP
jgi:hypothetical protein